MMSKSIQIKLLTDVAVGQARADQAELELLISKQANPLRPLKAASRASRSALHEFSGQTLICAGLLVCLSATRLSSWSPGPRRALIERNWINLRILAPFHCIKRRKKTCFLDCANSCAERLRLLQLDWQIYPADSQCGLIPLHAFLVDSVYRIALYLVLLVFCIAQPSSDCQTCMQLDHDDSVDSHQIKIGQLIWHSPILTRRTKPWGVSFEAIGNKSPICFIRLGFESRFIQPQL